MAEHYPIECPGCERQQDGENVHAEGRGFRCRVCALTFTTKDSDPQKRFFLITMHWATGEWRVEWGEFYRQILDKHAERINANQRHNARKARVIERGELGREYEANHPKTLAEAFGFAVDA